MSYGTKDRPDTPAGQQSITDRMVAGSRMIDEGASTAEVARAFKVSMATVYSWREKVRAAQADAKNLRGIR